MGDGGRAEAGLVGEDAAGDALLHDGFERNADRAAESGLDGEGVAEDQTECLTDVLDVYDQNDERGQNVNNRHNGHQLFGDLADALHAADNDEGDNDGGDHADDDAGHGHGLAEQHDRRGLYIAAEGVNGGVDGGGDGVDLGHVADAEGGDETEHTEDGGEPAPTLAEAVLDVVHRAADPVALLVAFTVLHGEQNLGILGDHAEQGGDPHPEHGAGAAGHDCAGNAGNIARADGGGERGGHSLERRDLSVTCLLPLEDFTKSVSHPVADPGKLNETYADAQVHACADQKNQHDGTPCKAVYFPNDVRKCHKNSFPSYYSQGIEGPGIQK